MVSRSDAAAVPHSLAPNTPPSFYRGSGRIAAFRGLPTEPVSDGSASRPEDWVASTVTRFGDEAAGLTVLGSGEVFRDAVRADPVGWLGAADGSAPELEVPLVKLLDAGERLPVHAHPSNEQAQHLGVWPQGKAEAWFVLDASPSAVVHLGWARDVTAAELAAWVEEQDVEAMLGAMRSLQVAPGDCVYVPPGMPHAIGAGIFLVEVQQAADLSILLEWKGFFADGSSGFLGVDRAAALGCVDLRELSSTRMDSLVVRDGLTDQAGARLLPPESEAYFASTVLRAGARLPAAYRTLVVLAGTGALRSPSVERPAVGLASGATLAVPAAAGPLRLEGSGDLIVLAFGPGTSHRG